FLCRGCENCAGLAARRAHPNLVQETDSLSFARPGIASGMGGLRRELRLASNRFADGAVSSLASHARGRLLCRGNLSSFERANLSARHLSLARNCSDCSFSFAELAAPDHFHFSAKHCIARDKSRHTTSALETNPDHKLRDDLHRDPNPGS